MAPYVRDRSMIDRVAPSVASILAVLLVYFVLPDPIDVRAPQPTPIVEYAPVPVPPRAADQTAEINLASSGGIGGGGASDATGGGPDGVHEGPPQFRPRQKDCVGNPPRQTEDPLSPPCVPFFDGDNGGATAQGVTATHITLAIYNDLGISGDLTYPSAAREPVVNRTAKTLLRYFQNRYQTYGRAVRVIAVASDDDRTCAGREADARRTRARVDPFAVMVLADGREGSCYPAYLARVFRIPTFVLTRDVAAKTYEQLRPFMWGFFPDQESEAAWSAAYICRALAGRPARFAPDPLLAAQTRTFGLTYASPSPRGPAHEEMAALLIDGTRRRCGLPMEVIPHGSNGSGDARAVMDRFRRKSITTVICYCDVDPINGVPAMRAAATSMGYSPEWYLDHGSDMARGATHRRYGDPAAVSFGTTALWRNPALPDQYWYRAVTEQEPGFVPSARQGSNLYLLYLMAFHAIQASGPVLDPEALERGMVVWSYRHLRDPFVPSGGFGYGPSGAGAYTFIDTAMAWWWDPTGTPPGGESVSGCIRVAREGERSYAGTWPADDADLFVAAAPCSEDRDPSSVGP